MVGDSSCGKTNVVNHPHDGRCSYMGVVRVSTDVTPLLPRRAGIASLSLEDVNNTIAGGPT